MKSWGLAFPSLAHTCSDTWHPAWSCRSAWSTWWRTRGICSLKDQQKELQEVHPTNKKIKRNNTEGSILQHFITSYKQWSVGDVSFGDFLTSSSLNLVHVWTMQPCPTKTCFPPQLDQRWARGYRVDYTARVRRNLLAQKIIHAEPACKANSSHVPRHFFEALFREEQPETSGLAPKCSKPPAGLSLFSSRPERPGLQRPGDPIPFSALRGHGRLESVLTAWKSTMKGKRAENNEKQRQKKKSGKKEKHTYSSQTELGQAHICTITCNVLPSTCAEISDNNKTRIHIAEYKIAKTLMRYLLKCATRKSCLWRTIRWE